MNFGLVKAWLSPYSSPSMTYFLSYKSYKGKDHERTCNPHFIFKLQNSFGGICHSNVPCWITGSKNHSNQTNVLFLLSAFLRGSLNAMVSSPSHFWSEVRRERTEPVCYRISGISGIRDSLSSFADSKAKNSGLQKQNSPGFHFSDAKKLPDSGIQIPLLGEKHDKSWTQRS